MNRIHDNGADTFMTNPIIIKFRHFNQIYCHRCISAIQSAFTNICTKKKIRKDHSEDLSEIVMDAIFSK